ncbi:MAG: lysylphosphatidylglycerol synthase transmembrane domain-containing protein [Terriglobales bacterium]
MTTKRIIVSAVVVAALAGLVYMQFREWRHFDWSVFWEQTTDTRKLYLLSAVGLIYLTYLLRAVRWKVFLRPVRRASAKNLIAPTLIGFTGLALLGRPGEFARPYLISRREGLTMSSQVAVWAVERIFDIGSFTVLMTIDIFSMDFSRYPVLQHYRKDFLFAGVILIGLVAFLAGTAYVVRCNAAGVARWVQRRFAGWAPSFAHHAEQKVYAFSEGLHTIHDLGSFVQLTGLSLLIWFLIAVSYRQVMHAYPSPLRELTVSNVVLIIGFSMVGSLVQLPAIGGGMQAATIGGINHYFGVPGEMAVSCGIMLWLTCFMVVIPAGLILAHREHVSFTKISRESPSEQEAET